MKNSFFQDNQDLYQPLINKIWHACNNSKALYLRGSANIPLNTFPINMPWDIDLVLFCINLTTVEESTIRKLVYSFNTEISPHYPFIDLSIFTQNSIKNSPYAFQHCLLNLNLNSRLLIGCNIAEIKDIRLSKNQRLKLLNYYLCIMDNKSDDFSNNLKTYQLNIDGLNRKCKNLIKQVYRLNNLLNYLNTNLFSRDMIKSLENFATLKYSEKKKMYSLISKENYTASDFLFVIKVCKLVKNEVLFNDNSWR